LNPASAANKAAALALSYPGEGPGLLPKRAQEVNRGARRRERTPCFVRPPRCMHRPVQRPPLPSPGTAPRPCSISRAETKTPPPLPTPGKSALTLSTVRPLLYYPTFFTPGLARMLGFAAVWRTDRRRYDYVPNGDRGRPKSLFRRASSLLRTFGLPRVGVDVA
jgi:hypothetical protein